MEENTLSQIKLRAILTRLDVLNQDMTLLKVKFGSEADFINNRELLTLLGVTNRTMQRWRKSGRLPFIKLGKKIYYRADIILNSFKLGPNCPIPVDHPPPEYSELKEDNAQQGCERCPLFLILNA